MKSPGEAELEACGLKFPGEKRIGACGLKFRYWPNPFLGGFTIDLRVSSYINLPNEPTPAIVEALRSAWLQGSYHGKAELRDDFKRLMGL